MHSSQDLIRTIKLIGSSSLLNTIHSYKNDNLYWITIESMWENSIYLWNSALKNQITCTVHKIWLELLS